MMHRNRQRLRDEVPAFPFFPMRSTPAGMACGSLVVIASLMAGAAEWAAAEQPAAPAGAPEPAAPAAAPAPPAAAAAPATPPAAFQPQDISIGEPISLPFATPLTQPAAKPQDPAARSMAPGFTPPASVLAPSSPATPPADGAVSQGPGGNGWLGIAVDDSLVTGRLVVVEVAPDGPAAKAGVKPQDVLLAINGSQLHTSDELAATLAAIAPGQRVKMALGRDSRVDDLTMLAATRPPEAVARDWQSANQRSAPPQPSLPSQQMPLERGTAAPLASAAPSPLPAVMPEFKTPEIRTPPVVAQPLPSPLPSGTVAAAPSLLTGPETSGARQPAATASGRTALGVRTVPVNPDMQSRFHLADPQGAFVIGVVQDLPAAKAGVPPGSVIVALDRQPVRSPQDLSMLVTHGRVGTPVTLHYVLPGGESKQTDVVLQSLEEPLERALVGDAGGSQAVSPPTLQPAPQTSRRLAPQAMREQRQVVYPTQPASAYDTTPSTSPSASTTSVAEESLSLERLEPLLRRMTTQMERIERRLDRLESGR